MIEEKKIAILIDADNTSPEYMKIVIEEAAKEGIITYRRVYGDFTKQQLKSWTKEILNEYALSPIHSYDYTTGKNSTDITMVIDAMDILYTGHADVFCLVTTDSDFTRLTTKLREAGKKVIGMGQQKTVGAFVKACNSFKYLDLITKATKDEKPNTTKEQKQKQVAVGKGKKDNKDSVETKEVITKGKSAKEASEKAPIKVDKTKLPEDIRQSIIDIIDEYTDAEGWTLVSKIGDLLPKQYPDFDTRNYGFKRMINFLEAEGFKIKVKEDKSTYVVKK